MVANRKIVALMAVSISAAGCAGSLGAMPPPVPLLEAYPGPDTEGTRRPGGTARADTVELTGVVTLPQALSAALLGSPDIAAFSWEVRAAEAQAIQEGLYFNPELEVEIEEFGGNKNRGGFSTAQTTLRLSQVVDLSGVVARRRRLAEHDARLAGWEYRLARLDVFARTAQFFIDVAAAQRRLELARENLRLAQKVTEAVGARVEAGKVSPLNLTRSRVLLSRSRLEAVRAEAAFDASRTRLAATWGQHRATFERVEARLDAPGVLPALEQLLLAAEESPVVAARRAEIARQDASVGLESVRAIPALRLSAGLQRFEDNGELAAVVGLGMDLPLFDRNQGAIERARSLLEAARERSRSALVEVKAAVVEGFRRLQTLKQTIASFDERIIPAARRVFDAANEAYRSGKLGILDLLDARRTLVELKTERLRALADFYKEQARIEVMLGRPLAGETTEKQQAGHVKGLEVTR